MVDALVYAVPFEIASVTFFKSACILATSAFAVTSESFSATPGASAINVSAADSTASVAPSGSLKFGTTEQRSTLGAPGSDGIAGAT